jgi:aldehyde dehydrogenase (NAD(P)+)
MDTAQFDAALRTLQQRKRSFARAPVRDKIAMLRRLRQRTGRVSAAWVAAACRAKGIAADSALAGEEWTSGPYALASGLAALEATLTGVAGGSDVLDGFPVWTRGDGRVAVRVFPATAQDRVFLSGHRADVWMQPGITEDTLYDTVASFYRSADPEGAVCLVLGAGNIASIAPLDILYRMFVRGDVVMVKLNPVNEYLGEFFEDIFAPIVDAGWLRFAYGDGAVGARLAGHRDVDRIHVTGSAATHDAIVYGTGPGAAERKVRDQRLVDKPITSELGGVGPTIVVPGNWTTADLRYQAEHIATQKMHNAGYNCVACQVLVLPTGWDLGDRLLEEIAHVLAAMPERHPYYPGTEARIEAAVGSHPQPMQIGNSRTPVTLVEVHSEHDAAEGFTIESFAPVLTITRLPAPSVPEFLAGAVRFANGTLTGNLSANIIIDPPTARAHAATVDGVVADLHYGTIAINTWAGVAYGMPRVPWGAFPGAGHDDIRSGMGVVHNALMFDRSERTIVRGPFAPFPRSLRWGESHVEPKPPTFVTNRRAAVIGERLTKQAVTGSWRDIPGIVTAAMRG